jgi:hypothetical protein
MIQHASLSTEKSCDILIRTLCVCVRLCVRACVRAACARQFLSGFVPSFQILNHLTGSRETRHKYCAAGRKVNDINFNFMHSGKRKARIIKSEKTPATFSPY